jgi:hypothetical protein
MLIAKVEESQNPKTPNPKEISNNTGAMRSAPRLKVLNSRFFWRLVIGVCDLRASTCSIPGPQVFSPAF